MPWHAIAPTDKVLSFANVLHVHRNHSGRALLDRCFPGEERCGSGRCCDPRMLRSPGATVSLLTNAVGVRAVLEYDDCRTSCAGKYPACYVPLRQCSDGGPTGSHRGCSSRRSEAYCIEHKKAKCGGTCKNHCEPKLYVNGARLPLPAESSRDRYDGLVTLDLLAVRLRPGGCLHVATDVDEYAEHVRNVVASDARWSAVPPLAWRPETMYERRGLDRGRTITDLSFVLREPK